ncbi:hypothetical protein TWF217_005922 [Orbilia oligospora]|nr:hypothetical protein TWF217_005922 [Orbilia oligospora]
MEAQVARKLHQLAAKETSMKRENPGTERLWWLAKRYEDLKVATSSIHKYIDTV